MTYYSNYGNKNLIKPLPKKLISTSTYAPGLPGKLKNPNIASLTRRALKEDSCLICTAHNQPKIELTVRTRGGNDYFIQQHAKHLPKKQVPLNEIEKETVRQTLNSVDNVDLDHTPHPLPHNIPTPETAIGVIDENTSSIVEGNMDKNLDI